MSGQFPTLAMFSWVCPSRPFKASSGLWWHGFHLFVVDHFILWVISLKGHGPWKGCEKKTWGNRQRSIWCLVFHFSPSDWIWEDVMRVIFVHWAGVVVVDGLVGNWQGMKGGCIQWGLINHHLLTVTSSFENAFTFWIHSSKLFKIVFYFGAQWVEWDCLDSLKTWNPGKPQFTDPGWIRDTCCDRVYLALKDFPQELQGWKTPVMWFASTCSIRWEALPSFPHTLQMWILPLSPFLVGGFLGTDLIIDWILLSSCCNTWSKLLSLVLGLSPVSPIFFKEGFSIGVSNAPIWRLPSFWAPDSAFLSFKPFSLSSSATARKASKSSWAMLASPQ